MTRIQARGWLAWSLVALFVLALTAAPLWAASQGVGAESWTKAFKYAACGLGIAAAATGLALAATVAMCLSVFFAEAG
jgi:hypothetical protein